MPPDVPLERSPVFRNLDYRWAWYGLSFGDVPFVAVPGLVVLGMSLVVDLSAAWSLVVSGATATALVLLKWRRPEGALQVALHMALTPRRLSHKERDHAVRPFPLDEMQER